jgi:trk system potassium uptake protein TrkA
LGIDTTVSATSVILAHIEQELPMTNLLPLMTLRGGGLEMVEVKIPDRSPAVGKTLREILLPQSALVSLVVDSDGAAKVPTGDTVIHAADELLAVTSPDMEGALRRALTGVQDGNAETR